MHHNLHLGSGDVSVRQGSIHACDSKEKEHHKIVCMVSSYHETHILGNKPSFITSCNSFMGGVDLNDMLTNFYEDGC